MLDQTVRFASSLHDVAEDSPPAPSQKLEYTTDDGPLAESSYTSELVLYWRTQAPVYKTIYRDLTNSTEESSPWTEILKVPETRQGGRGNDRGHLMMTSTQIHENMVDFLAWTLSVRRECDGLLKCSHDPPPEPAPLKITLARRISMERGVLWVKKTYVIQLGRYLLPLETPSSSNYTTLVAASRDQISKNFVFFIDNGAGTSMKRLNMVDQVGLTPPSKHCACNISHASTRYRPATVPS
ncbi:hypothetical protein ONZ45_g9816 [Pleurotus djamor]|nr:hypothetical protein ONZ45_g9816 [Pleurotus djamor]